MLGMDGWMGGSRAVTLRLQLLQRDVPDDEVLIGEDSRSSMALSNSALKSLITCEQPLSTCSHTSVWYKRLRLSRDRQREYLLVSGLSHREYASVVIGSSALSRTASLRSAQSSTDRARHSTATAGAATHRGSDTAARFLAWSDASQTICAAEIHCVSRSGAAHSRVRRIRDASPRT